MGGARLPDQRPGRELRAGPAGGAGAAHRLARGARPRGAPARARLLAARGRRPQAPGGRGSVRCRRSAAGPLAGPLDPAEDGTYSLNVRMRTTAMTSEVHYRTCPFCEATCGLEIETADREVMSIRGDEDDVLSRGFLCPKAYGLKELHEDPDRLTVPLVRRDGELVEASWEEAFEEIDRRLPPILEKHGRNAAAAYIGNPNAHNLSALVYGSAWLRALGSQNVYSASTVDQMPKQVSSGLMFGTMLSVPVPDVDRTDHLLILGANPLVSNGSLLTAPDMRGRVRAIQERGGKIVVVDPRRTRTAEAADEHQFIRPGTDAHLLFGMVHTLFDEGLVRVQPRIAEHLDGLDTVERLARPFTPEAVAPVCG